MQTYNSIRGMTVCVSGGEYVNRKDAENKIAALRDKLSEMIIVNGQALACSPYVKSAYDKQDAEIARLQDLIKRTNELFNPCGHTGLESSACEICGYPVPSKLIATLKEQVKELEVTLDLIHDADMRAIKMWQEAHPDKENMWPDQAMMVCWLMEELDGERTHNRILKESQADWFEQMENRERKIEEQEKMIAAFMKEMDADQVESEILHGKIDALEAENKRLNEALQKIHDLCVSDSRWWNDESHAPDHHRPITRILQKFNKIAREALRED